MTPEKSERLAKGRFERDVKMQMVMMTGEHRDCYATSDKAANFEAANRLIAAGIREAVETGQHNGIITIRHRLVRI